MMLAGRYIPQLTDKSHQNDLQKYFKGEGLRKSKAIFSTGYVLRSTVHRIIGKHPDLQWMAAVLFLFNPDAIQRKQPMCKIG